MSNSEIITEIPEGGKKAVGKISKAYMDYKAKGWAKNKLNGQRVLKKYQNVQQATMIMPPTVQNDAPANQMYKQEGLTYRPKEGGLMTNVLRVRDVILQEIKDKQSQAETIARETIGNRLLAHNYKKDFLQELKLKKEIQTTAGEKKTVREILEQALTGMRDKLNAKRILEQNKLIKKIENEKALSSISTEDLKINKRKNIYASVVQDATNSALSRLVELDGKQYIANHLAIEAQNILPTLKKIR
jgi:hypothetical protein